jgi:hypothetical protein
VKKNGGAMPLFSTAAPAGQPLGCPSQKTVLTEKIDKFRCTCQAQIMMKKLRILVLLMWSKIKIIANLVAENIALPF